MDYQGTQGNLEVIMIFIVLIVIVVYTHMCVCICQIYMYVYVYDWQNASDSLLKILSYYTSVVLKRMTNMKKTADPRC